MMLLFLREQFSNFISNVEAVSLPDEQDQYRRAKDKWAKIIQKSKADDKHSLMTPEIAIEQEDSISIDIHRVFEGGYLICRYCVVPHMGHKIFHAPVDKTIGRTLINGSINACKSTALSDHRTSGFSGEAQFPPLKRIPTMDCKQDQEVKHCAAQYLVEHCHGDTGQFGLHYRDISFECDAFNSCPAQQGAKQQASAGLGRLEGKVHKRFQSDVLHGGSIFSHDRHITRGTV